MSRNFQKKLIFNEIEKLPIRNTNQVKNNSIAKKLYFGELN